MLIGVVSLLDIMEIKKIIPHRAPFLLIDKVIELEAGEMAVGIKQVTYNEFFFKGHFPSEPVMPGVLIIEALAQVGAVAILSLKELKGNIVYFGGINKARFKSKVIPGDTLRLETKIIKRKGPVGIGQAKAYVGDELVTETELTFFVK